MTPETMDRAARMLLEARRDHRTLEALPADCRPQGLDDAYVVQDAFARQDGRAVVGWKIGATNVRVQKLLKADGPFAGRIFEGCVHESPARLPARDFVTRGVEGEFAFRLRSDLLPTGAPFDRAAAARAVDRLYPAIEIVDPAYPTDSWLGVGVDSIVADNGAHGALVLGPPEEGWSGLDLAGHRASMRIDGELRAEGVGADVLGHPLDALAWLANDRAQRGDGLRAGQIVTTGTCTGYFTVGAGERAIADFATLGSVNLTFTD